MMDTLFDRLNIRTGRALMLTEDAHKQEERETEAKKKKIQGSPETLGSAEEVLKKSSERAADTGGVSQQTACWCCISESPCKITQTALA